MNRCLRFLRLPPWLISAVLALALGAVASKAEAQVRQFPAAALRGVMEITAPPNLRINGQAERLSPGARIKSPGNTLIMSASLVGQAVLVNYLRDGQGMIHEVWILNAQEAQQKRPGMETRTNFSFGSDADKPKTDDGKTPFDQLPKFQAQ